MSTAGGWDIIVPELANPEGVSGAWWVSASPPLAPTYFTDSSQRSVPSALPTLTRDPRTSPSRKVLLLFLFYR